MLEKSVLTHTIHTPDQTKMINKLLKHSEERRNQFRNLVEEERIDSKDRIIN